MYVSDEPNYEWPLPFIEESFPKNKKKLTNATMHKILIKK